jgi:O-antigen biosynthesis protein WbqV
MSPGAHEDPAAGTGPATSTLAGAGTPPAGAGLPAPLPYRLVPDLERLDPGALLGRPERSLDLAGAADVLRGRRILVTGAGGSVGVPLVERLLAYGPERLVLLDSHEDSLYRLQRRLREAAPPPALLLGDVRNPAKVAALFRDYRPDVVFHLAAYKHVHFGEGQPDEPIAVNVLGTRALVDASLEHDVAVFVYTSSDKAVDPSGAYGATKRLAELVVHEAGRRAGGRYVVVRFVNVLGTRGSVIETFLEQLAASQPLTITDAAMTRYWMSMREAVELLLAAAVRGSRGATLLLDPGPPVSVLDMAARLRALVGATPTPSDAVYFGARPGERLAEELASPTERLATGPTAGLLTVERQGEEPRLAAVRVEVAGLAAALDAEDPTLGARLMALARALG